MKKLIYAGIITLFMVLKTSPSYAISNCANHIDEVKTVNTNNLLEYIQENYKNKEINYFCSNDYCHYVRGRPLSLAITDYSQILKKKISEENLFEAEIKGYPVTRISVNLCE